MSSIEFEELLESAIEDLKRMYLDETDKRDWALAWSGGKDSTGVLGITTNMVESLPIENRNRIIHVVMSDTIIENPVLESYMHDQAIKLEKYIEKNNLPLTIEVVSRKKEQSYFYLILGRGYFLPQNNGAGRWCTDRLKLQPQNAKLKEINPSYILIGTRSSESEKRKQSIEKWTSMNDLSYKIGDHANLTNSKTFMPIVDFTIEDVWRYLSKVRLGWTSSHAVRTLYKDATGECGFTSPKETEKKAAKSESCGARFGCWVCPVVLNDRSTEQMSEVHDWMKPLTDWRMTQIKVFGAYIPVKPIGQLRKERSKVLRAWEVLNEQIKLITKSGHKRNGNRMTDKQGNFMNNQGTFTVEAREFLFEELIKTENDVNEKRLKSGLPLIKLISNEEIEMIKEQWKIDREQFPHLITNVNGKTIDDLKEILENGNNFE